MEKECLCCNVIKPLESFSNKKNGLYGKNCYCRECVKEKDAKRWQNMSEDQKEKRREYQRELYKSGRRNIKYNKEYERNKKRKQREKIENKIKDNLRERIRQFINKRGYNKYSSTYTMIGCSPVFLREYLELKFVDGMSWDNYGEWHIDHIIPLSSATNEESMMKLCHYTNLQPLWAIDNIKKGKRII
jgi:hypothetical protein